MEVITKQSWKNYQTQKKNWSVYDVTFKSTPLQLYASDTQKDI